MLAAALVLLSLPREELQGGLDVFAAALVGAWLVAAVCPFLWPSTTVVAEFGQTLLVAAFAWVHGAQRYGVRAITAFSVAVLVVSALLEEFSIKTGVPFGFFTHQPSMGPRLLDEPLIIPVSYLGIGYLAWAIVSALLGDADLDRRASSLPALAMTAPFIATGWDAMTDPWFSTVERGWIFAHPGGLYGVPFSNFVGWIVVVTASLFLAGLAVRCLARPAANPPRTWFALPPLFMAMQIVPVACAWRLYPGESVATAPDQPWNSRLLYEATTIIGLVTCVAFGLVGLAAALRRQSHNSITASSPDTT